MRPYYYRDSTFKDSYRIGSSVYHIPTFNNRVDLGLGDVVKISNDRKVIDIKWRYTGRIDQIV